MLLLLLACLHRGPATPAGVDPGEVPRLPSPEAPVYAAGLGAPADRLVARVAAGLPWDEALSGAAGALALQTGEAPDLATARWAAWRAGFPFPLRTLIASEVAAGAWPDELVASLGEILGPGDHLGLARARHGEADRWVALVAAVPAEIPPFERQISVAGSLSLPPDLLWTLVSPTGDHHRGRGPAPILDEEGEWWLTLENASEILVEVPIYVGIPAAGAPPLVTPGAAAAGPDDALAQAFALVEDLRRQFDLPALARDATLDALARAPLHEAAAGSWDAEAAHNRLHKSGFVMGAAAAACAERTVALCLDQLLRSVSGRRALLGPDWRIVGGAAEVSSGRVVLVLQFAAE